MQASNIDPFANYVEDSTQSEEWMPDTENNADEELYCSVASLLDTKGHLDIIDFDYMNKE